MKSRLNREFEQGLTKCSTASERRQVKELSDELCLTEKEIKVYTYSDLLAHLFEAYAIPLALSTIPH